MNIPIVQGVAVPAGGPTTTSSGPNPGSTPYVTVNDGGGATNYNTFEKPEQQPKEWKDVVWAVLFYAHLAVMISVIAMNGDNFAAAGGEGGGANTNGLTFLVGLCAVVAIFVSSAALGFMMKYSETLVKISLVFTVAMSGVIAVLGLMSGDMFMGIFGLIMFAIGICYARMVWPRIPFAAANLNTALTAVKANMGLTVIAYVMVLLAFGWSMLWFVGVGSYLNSDNSMIVFCLLVSYYWVHQVLSNTIHVTTAGTVGTWWFVPAEASSGCWSPAVQDSYCRATTLSFGSICLGSLIVAVVQALRAMAHIARQNEDLGMLACILECILGCIEGIIDYINQWAYVYVGLYGFSYLEAGRNVWTLFQSKGWTVIITDDLAERVLLLISVGVGIIVGLVGMASAIADPNLVAALQLESGFGTAGFIIGLIVGFVFCSILMSVVGSAVNTVIVCYAESPAEFQQNHPQLANEMRTAWVAAWPDLM